MQVQEISQATDPPGKSHINKWEDLESGIMNPVHFCLSDFPQLCDHRTRDIIGCNICSLHQN